MVDDFVESVSHDRDQHVQERDLRDECRENEQDVALCCVGVHFEAIHVEFSEHEQVLVKDWVDEEVVEDRRHDGCIFTSCQVGIEIQHVQSGANVDQDDDDDPGYVSNVSDRLQDECHIERCIVE